MLDQDKMPAMAKFLAGIGIEVAVEPVPEDSFLPGILIAGTRILVDPARCLSSGDILHEAGHIAVLPSHLRPLLYDNVDASIEEALAAYRREHPDLSDPVMQGVFYGSEQQAVAWSYAASVELELSPDVVFFEGSHKAAPGHLPIGIMEQLCYGFFVGIDGLVSAGMTDPPVRLAGDPLHPHSFPRMKRWMQV